MLTDIFARRYKDIRILETYDEAARRLIVQGFGLLEQIFPYYVGGQESAQGKHAWTALQAQLARELGLRELSPSTWGYWTPQKQWIGGTNTVAKVCENWMLQSFDSSILADRFVKERLSLIELGFRLRGNDVLAKNIELPKAIAEAKKFEQDRAARKGLFVPGNRADGVQAANATLNSEFRAAVEELNARFRQASINLNYHNGFIQIEIDEFVAREVSAPFWKLVEDSKWQNVDHDMKEALNLRDTDGRDPAFYAARALESAIKVVSEDKQFSTGKERGAANYIDNLKRGNFIAEWEANSLKGFFSEVRNRLGHGPGSAALETLTVPQTDWAIATCMSWIRSLILRS